MIIIKLPKFWSGLLVHACYPSTSEAGGSQAINCIVSLNVGYLWPCLKTKTTTITTTEGFPVCNTLLWFEVLRDQKSIAEWKRRGGAVC